MVLQLVFTFCYFGDRLTTKALEVNDAIYDVPWWNFPLDKQKLIQPIMMRAQKPFILTGYSLTSLSLESFKEVPEHSHSDENG